uniref:DENN domain containing 1A n=1 Tax=Nothobranchius furzeri TaxID=105023 RepID=A0A8C6NH35_NOTFU
TEVEVQKFLVFSGTSVLFLTHVWYKGLSVPTWPSLPFSHCSLTVSQVGQNFTFVLTDIESKQRFGFCRLSSGAHTCYCILSYLPWFEVFYKLLNILADYAVKGQESEWQELLVSLHTLPIPEPGVPVHLGVVSDPKQLDFLLPENTNLTEYIVAVDVNNLLHIYASMLYERRILICCSKLSTLTACVHGSAAILYPMHWQHVYIPVLPQHLLDYCCAPMPYLIGVHSSLMEKVRGMALDDVVVLNVDTNTLETPYDDLQSLPNDVVSSLKSRLKKVSATTGSGVARAFVRSQAALFGSYRNALQIEAGEPITFNEETFINHRSSAMRQFLQNAIQLQLFKQFIDNRLDLLNSGQGFSDIFEEEISMGEYAGESAKGGGAIFQSVKTKANPAMRTVYKLAKDHAKMRIKEVKSRLKQKVVNSASLLQSWLTFSRDLIHPSTCRPQPYRSLKEVDLIEGEDAGFGAESHTAPPSPVTEKFSNINLLGDIFVCQDEPDSHPVTLAKSLEDLRTPKDSEELQAKFTYQRLDLSSVDRSRMLPGLKLSDPYTKLWSSERVPPVCERLSSTQLPVQLDSSSPARESSGTASDLLDPSNPANITIPRPHGRKTPELGSVLAPPAAQPRPKVAAFGEGRTSSGGQEFRQALSMTSDGDLLGPTKAAEDSMDLLSLLDPLNNSSQSNSTALTETLDISSKPPLPPRPFPPGLPPFTLHPHIPMNPFTPSLQHYSPTVCGNPFSAVCVPSPGSYIHTSSQPQAFSTLPGLYRQHSPSQGPPQSTFPSSVSPVPRSDSSLTLSSLVDSTSVFSSPMNMLPKPLQAENQGAQDPFGDLLSLATPAAPQKKKVEELRRKWETFD